MNMLNMVAKNFIACKNSRFLNILLIHRKEIAHRSKKQNKKCMD